MSPTRPSEAWDYIARGAAAYAGSLGTIEVIPTPPNAVLPDGQIQYWIGPPPQAVILWVDQPEAAAPLVHELASRHSIVVTIGALVEGAWGHVQVPAADAAQLLADRLPVMLGPRRSYILFHHAAGNALGQSAYVRFRDRARLSYDLTQLEEVELRTDAGVRAIELLEQSLERFRHAGLVVLLEADPVLGVDLARLTALNCPLAVAGSSPSLWPAIESGVVVAAAGPIHAEIGQTAVKIALEAFSPEARPRDFRTVPAEVILRQNLADFSARYFAARRPGHPSIPRPDVAPGRDALTAQ